VGDIVDLRLSTRPASPFSWSLCKIWTITDEMKGLRKPKPNKKSNRGSESISPKPTLSKTKVPNDK
jgi:hypothetical protein